MEVLPRTKCNSLKLALILNSDIIFLEAYFGALLLCISVIKYFLQILSLKKDLLTRSHAISSQTKIRILGEEEKENGLLIEQVSGCFAEN